MWDDLEELRISRTASKQSLAVCGVVVQMTNGKVEYKLFNQFSKWLQVAETPMRCVQMTTITTA